jgi:DNA-binding HxlR family transcriptional regulator
MSELSMEETPPPEVPEVPEAPASPVFYAVRVLNGKWKLHIMYNISQVTGIRFNNLRRKIIGISNLMLSKTLQQLEHDKIVERRQYNEMPPRVEYSLTELGRAVIPTIEQLGKWGEQVWCEKMK